MSWISQLKEVCTNSPPPLSLSLRYFALITNWRWQISILNQLPPIPFRPHTEPRELELTWKDFRVKKSKVSTWRKRKERRTRGVSYVHIACMLSLSEQAKPSHLVATAEIDVECYPGDLKKNIWPLSRQPVQLQQMKAENGSRVSSSRYPNIYKAMPSHTNHKEKVVPKSKCWTKLCRWECQAPVEQREKARGIVRVHGKASHSKDAVKRQEGNTDGITYGSWKGERTTASQTDNQAV